jgi:hypothetical protein
MVNFTRRGFTAGLAATLGLAGPASAAGWDQVLERAQAMPQLHAIVVSLDGREVLAASFRGPGLDRPANVKSVPRPCLPR